MLSIVCKHFFEKRRESMKDLEEIREALKGKNLSKVGRSVGVTRAYMSLLRKGRAKNPSYSVLKRLSDALERIEEEESRGGA